MAIPLKVSTGTGQLANFLAADALDIDKIEPRSAGNLVIGSTLGASDEVQLGKSGELVRVMGDLQVDGSETVSTNETVTGTFNANGNVNLGNNSGDTVNVGGGTSDTVTLKADMGVGAGLVKIGSSTSDYLLDLWLDAVNSNGPALAAYNLNATGTNAGAYAIGIDPSLLANATATDLMTALDELDAAITGGGGESLQQTYAIGNTIDVTAANGIIDFANDTATDTTTVLKVSRAPGSSTAGIGLDIDLGANTTGTALQLNQQGSGNAVDIQDGGSSVLLVTGAGAVTLTPTSGQAYSLTTAGAGTISLSSASGNITIDATAAELNLDDVGSWGGTLSQSSDRVLTQTSSTEILNGATSLIGAINRIANHIDADGGGAIESVPIENGVTITAGDVVAQSSTSGRVTQWNGNNDTNSKFIGVSLTTGTGDAGGTVKSRVAYPGNKFTDSGASFTAGGALFGPDGTGRPTNTAPSGTGDALKRIGWAHTSTTYMIDPGPTVVL